MKSIIQIWKVLTMSEKKISILLIIFMFTAMIFEIVGIGAFIPLVSVLVGEQSPISIPLIDKLFLNFSDKNNSDSIIFFTIFFSVIIIVKNLFLIFSNWFNHKNLQNLSKRISRDLFKNYLLAPYFFHTKNNSSKLLYNCTDATEVFKEASGHLINLLSELLVLAGISIFLLYFEPKGFLVSLVIMLIIGFIYFRINKNRLFELGKKIELNEKEKIKNLMQGLGGIKIIKILKKEKNFLKEFNKYNIQTNFYRFLSNFITSLPRFVLEIIVVIIATISLIFLSLKDISGTEIFLKASVFGFAAFRLLPSLNRIIGSYERFRVCKFQINTVYTQMNFQHFSKSELKENSKLTEIDEFKSLKLKNINFKFEEDQKDILKDVNLEILRGEYIGIIGKTGSGKSTLIDLIIGLLSPSDGEIKVNDIDINDVNNWEKKIGYIPQFIYLTDDTLKKNIALGVDESEIEEDQILRSVKEADLTNFVKNLDYRANDILGERGIKISGGEMQRIGLARAIYNNPDLLIFDEFTSSLDSRTEEGILENIKRYKGKRTIIIISHKLSTLKDCDRIIEVVNGTIEEKNNV